ncbi:MAG TPA: ABC transporter substrate-binding protein [Pseudonocardia sp.]|nr:ABC transporter substrate-binding protein [Pseudonocardia sp.]
MLAACAPAPHKDHGETQGRLVTLGGAAAGLALVLGQAQVGTVSFLAADPLPTAIARIQEAPVADVSGAGGEVEVERLAALAPDLLVGFRGRGPDSTLADLATLHAVPRTGDVGVDCLALAAGMGAEERARAVLASVRNRTAEIAGRLRDGGSPTVSVLSPGLDGGSLYVLGTATPAGAVVEALGLPRPEAQRDPGDVAMPFVPVSMERIAEHDADLVLLLTGPTADPAFLRDQPLWQRLDAVRAGRVVQVDAMRWATMSCLLGNMSVLDDLAALLLDGAAPVHGAASPAGLARLHAYRSRSTTSGGPPGPRGVHPSAPPRSGASREGR